MIANHPLLGSAIRYFVDIVPCIFNGVKDPKATTRGKTLYSNLKVLVNIAIPVPLN